MFILFKAIQIVSILLIFWKFHQKFDRFQKYQNLKNVHIAVAGNFEAGLLVAYNQDRLKMTQIPCTKNNIKNTFFYKISYKNNDFASNSVPKIEKSLKKIILPTDPFATFSPVRRRRAEADLGT